MPIPLVTEKFENKCCSISTIPVHISIFITIHTSHIIPIGLGNESEHMVVNLSDDNTKKISDIELVGLLCAKYHKYFCICYPSTELDVLSLMKIGTSLAYTKRRKLI